MNKHWIKPKSGGYTPTADTESGVCPKTDTDSHLRDYFAGQALAGMFANPYSNDVAATGITEACYVIADAMMKARAK